MTTPQTIRTLQIVILSVFLTGCGAGCGAFFETLDSIDRGSHWQCKLLGSLDLSVKDSKCEAIFKMNDHNPRLALSLSDTNSATRATEKNPDWPIVIQVDAFDKSSGRLVMSSRVTKEQMDYEGWVEHGKWSPETRVFMDIKERYGDFQEGHSYKFVLTVLQEAKDLGSAKVFMEWSIGGDSL